MCIIGSGEHMVFWSKSKKKQDLENVKRAVSAEQKSKNQEIPKIDIAKMPERPAFAPLFVKIERYRNVLATIDNLKSILLGVRDLLNLMQQIDKIKLESEMFLQKNIQEIVKNIAEMDKEFVRPKGIPEGIKLSADDSKESKELHAGKVESYVDELSRELERLRSQLRSIE